MPDHSLLQRLKERKLVQWALAYLAGAWFLVEASDLVVERFRWSEGIGQAVIILAVFGFFLALILAWYHGEKGRQRVSGPELLMVAALLVIAGGVVSTLGPEEEASSPDETVAVATQEGDRPSIAVLPLENRSGLEEDAYFTDGIHDEIITQLSKISGLRVRARTSVMEYRDSPKNIRQIGEELNARYLVEGGVQRAGETVRINIQLVDSEKDEHVFADTYDRELSVENLLAVQRGVALRIADALEATLTPADRERIEARPTGNLDAYDFYLRGSYHLERMTVDGATRAIEYFEEAIDEDPNYAAPYGGLARAWTLLGQPLDAVPTGEGLPKAKAAAEKALSLDPDLADAHLILGLVSATYEWDWEKAERLLKRAIELDPSYPLAHTAYAVYLEKLGRHEESIAEGTRAVQLDPLSLFQRASMAEFYYYARQYDRALEEAEKVLDMDPDYDRAREVLMWVYEELGMCEEYVALRRERLMASGAEPEALAGQATLEQACADSGFVGIWRWGLERNLVRIAAGEYVRPMELADDYARLGRIDDALEWLERAYDERDGDLAFIKTEPIYDGLRSDPRFQALLRRMNLE